MKIIETNLLDCYVVEPDKFGDDRGYFSPVFKIEDFTKFGFKGVVQESESKSKKGVLRGLHYQDDPYCQAKIVRVVSGGVVDIVVDLRKDSPTFGQYTYVYLNHDNFKQLYVPRGFAHGFLSTEDNTIFSYKVDNYYKPDMEGGIIYNDPDIAIPWDKICSEYGVEDFIVSDKDKIHPTLKLSKCNFTRGKK